MHRYDLRDEIAGLDPVEDCARISTLLATREFPWDITQALSFALFRTYAVPSIGRLLFETGEFTERTQKRYDDTVLVLDAVLEHGLASSEGRAAVRRMNQMHHAHAIPVDDLRYVLATFVVSPVRWVDAYGWRRYTEVERLATTTYYRELGRHMGITDIPATYADFERLMEDYEREHFAYDDGARAVADATLELLGTFPPNRWAPRAAVRLLAYSLMDDHLLDAFRYPRPSRWARAVCRGALATRGRIVRLLPVRTEPLYGRQNPTVRSYPNGYRVQDLGTFPGPAGSGCPVDVSR
ncbi:MAG: oxygenase MpaB family protein [Lapillicoccus sp.]